MELLLLLDSRKDVSIAKSKAYVSEVISQLSESSMLPEMMFLSELSKRLHQINVNEVAERGKDLQ